ncbi:u15-lycotoxin-Ls1a [Nephila pilipes]|uniref:U15-lycotoxin-Ls1a n=1 Tax=Nephila pilipes TaxID=299642 RepID=A0A8X6QME4_NEPPI|nr:u15-lycotoxin-Ls1a [Nephila pilipes]
MKTSNLAHSREPVERRAHFFFRKMKIVFLLAFIIVSVTAYEAYCPKRYTWRCVRAINECCSDHHCDRGQFCCHENCGNTCQFTTSFPTDGRKVIHSRLNWIETFQTFTEKERSRIERKMKILFLLAFMIAVGSAQVGFCPERSEIVCVRSITKCCSDADCLGGQFCCQENCGNTCHYPALFPTDGQKVVFDASCRIDPF